jgi:hypothetical protein
MPPGWHRTGRGAHSACPNSARTPAVADACSEHARRETRKTRATSAQISARLAGTHATLKTEKK